MKPIHAEDLFTRVYRTEMYRVVQDAHAVPLHTRLWMLAMADANNDGHAEYGGETSLEAVIGPNVVESTGEVKDWHRNAIPRAIKRAVDLGLLHPDSDVNCMVLNHRLNGFSGPGRHGCGYHGIKVRKTSDIS